MKEREREIYREPNVMIREPLALISWQKGHGNGQQNVKWQFENGTNGVQCGATTKWECEKLCGTRTR